MKNLSNNFIRRIIEEGTVEPATISTRRKILSDGTEALVLEVILLDSDLNVIEYRRQCY